MTSTYSLRYVDGTLKINAIKLVRELTKLGLAESKDAVEGQQIIMRGVEREAAEAIVARFANEAHARVELLEEAAHVHTFDVGHPARGDQPLQRLRVFGTELVWQRGHLGEWDDERRERFASVAECDLAIIAQRKQWSGRGLALADHEVEVVRRVSARDRGLEQQIRSSEWGVEAASVYADWLQRHGDPRGLIMALALARAVEPTPRGELERAWTAALLEHRAHLFGPFGDPSVYVELEWAAGQIGGVSLLRSRGPRETWPYGDRELLLGLLALPICACLRTLRTDSVALRDAEFWARLQAFEPEWLAGLRELVLATRHDFDDSRIDWSCFAGLERLDLLAYPRRPINLPSLRELTLRSSSLYWLVESLRASWLPSLRVLVLYVDLLSFGGQILDESSRSLVADLLALPVMTSLHSLKLVREHSWNPVHVLPSWLAEALVEAPALRGLAELDLREVSFESAGRTVLRAAKEQMPNLLIG